MTYRFKTHLDKGTMDDVIPRDYVHVFIIRDPLKSIRSWMQIIDEFPVNCLHVSMKGESGTTGANGGVV